MLSRLLYLDAPILRRGWPFFGLYLVLFTALTLVDGLSLTLFVQHVGTRWLPYYQGLSAIGVLLAVGAYLAGVDRLHAGQVFSGILAGPMLLFAVVWLQVCWRGADGGWLGLLYIGRELAFALVLLHFGTYLQNYFQRHELNRVMPFIYAGGRVGGIAGGAALERLSGLVQPGHLLLLAIALLGIGIAGVWWIQRRETQVDEQAGEDNQTAAGVAESTGARGIAGAPGQFLAFLWSNPLMFWITVTTIVYFFCRTFLNFQYSRYFEGAFAGEREMAQFLGRYTQWALALSLVLQLLVINRLVAWLGLRVAHLVYAVLLLAASLLGSGEMTLATAVFARLVEGELRFGLRNPVAQLTVNRFPRPVRIRARAWSLGLLIPLATLAASVLLAGLVSTGVGSAIGPLTGVLGLAYLAASCGLVRNFQTDSTASPVRETLPARPLSQARPL